MLFMGYPVPEGEIESCLGGRRDDHADAQTKDMTKIEAKKTFAGLTRALERLPIAWNHVIEKELLRFKEVQHVLIENVEQLFRDML